MRAKMAKWNIQPPTHTNPNTSTFSRQGETNYNHTGSIDGFHTPTIYQVCHTNTKFHLNSLGNAFYFHKYSYAFKLIKRDYI